MPNHPALVALLLAAAAPPDGDTVTLDRADPVIAATIAGAPATLAVVPDTGLDLADAFAGRVALDWRQAQRIDVGRIAVPVREAAAAVTIAGRSDERRATTSPPPCCRGHDGSIGATELPFATVRIGDPGALPERRFPAETGSRDGLSLPVRIGRDTIHVVLAPDNPETVATAAAAAILARAYGGHLQPAVRDVPVLFGITRPVRDMTFDRAVPLLGFAIPHLAVRVADFAGAAGLLRDAEAPAPAAPDTPDAIVVRHRPPPPQYRWAAVTLGRDWLGRCAMIAIHARSREVGLACPPG